MKTSLYAAAKNGLLYNKFDLYEITCEQIILIALCNDI